MSRPVILPPSCLHLQQVRGSASACARASEKSELEPAIDRWCHVEGRHRDRRGPRPAWCARSPHERFLHLRYPLSLRVCHVVLNRDGDWPAAQPLPPSPLPSAPSRPPDRSLPPSLRALSSPSRRPPPAAGRNSLRRMDPPRESVRDGVAPRHRPPLARGPDESSPALDEAKARGEAPGARADAAPGVGAAGAPGAAAGAAQAKPNTRRRAGSLVKQPTGEPSTRGGGGAAGPPAKGVTPPPAGARAGSPGAAAGSPAAAGALAGKEAHNTRNAHSRRPPSSSSSAATTAQSAAAPAAPVHAAASAPVNYPMPANAPPGYRPATARPPLSRIPAFPLVDAYVPEANSSDRRHPRQLLPKDLGFPTPEMADRIYPDDLDDRLLMATCAVLHGFENRALCPKEVAEVMLERDWLKNACVAVFSTRSRKPRSAFWLTSFRPLQRHDPLRARLDLHPLARLTRSRCETALRPSPRPFRARRRPHCRGGPRRWLACRAAPRRQARHIVVPQPAGPRGRGWGG